MDEPQYLYKVLVAVSTSGGIQTNVMYVAAKGIRYAIDKVEALFPDDTLSEIRSVDYIDEILV